eukprot:TRINITY_DN2752_c0_g1_i2.p1 TRINITY_DN2752_c0_g1~~TRINITY_DN2752_c0_g1_i2.p1  ORF type:complete len:235 (+),score=40.47 TRINITY_DN2752_c0_g1_i2:178-882(+)
MKSLMAQIREDPHGGPPGTDARATLQGLVKCCTARIAQYERFYSENDLHERAPIIEQQRLKLKRCLREAEEVPQSAPQVRRPQVGFTQLKIKLTAKEFKELQGRRKALKELAAKGQGGYLEKGQGTLSWETAPINKGHSKAMVEGTAGLYHEGQWTDPSRQTHRSPPNRAAWVTQSDFNTHLASPPSAPLGAQVTGPSSGPFITSRPEVVLTRPREPRTPIDPHQRFTPVVHRR